MTSQITRLTIVYSIVYSGEDQRKNQRSASLAFVRGIHRWRVNSPHKWPATRKMFLILVRCRRGKGVPGNTHVHFLVLEKCDTSRIGFLIESRSRLKKIGKFMRHECPVNPPLLLLLRRIQTKSPGWIIPWTFSDRLFRLSKMYVIRSWSTTGLL